MIAALAVFATALVASNVADRARSPDSEVVQALQPDLALAYEGEGFGVWLVEEYTPPEAYALVVTPRGDPPTVGILDVATGFIVARVTTGASPHVAVRRSTGELLVSDLLETSDGIVRRLRGFDPGDRMALQFDLDLLEDGEEAGLEGATYANALSVSGDGRYALYIATNLAAEPCPPGVFCIQGPSISVVDLFAAEPASVSQDLDAPFCDPPIEAIGPVRGIIACQAPAGLQFVDANDLAMGDANLLQTVLRTGGDPRGPLGVVRGYVEYEGRHGAVFANGSLRIQDAGRVRSVAIVPPGTTPVSNQGVARLPDSRLLVGFTRGGGEAGGLDGIVVFSIETLEREQVVPLLDVVRAVPLGSRWVLLVLQDGRLSTLDLLTEEIAGVPGVVAITSEALVPGATLRLVEPHPTPPPAGGGTVAPVYLLP